MLLTFAMSVGIVCAKTVYVSDELIITMREGKGNEYKIIESLKTGTPLEVIEESEKYLKVRTKSGSEGWVLKWYVNRKTPKPVVIAGLEKKVARLETAIAQYKKDKETAQGELKTARSDLTKKIEDLKQNLSTSKGKAEQTARELAVITKKYNDLFKESKDVVNLVKERDSLKEANSNLQTKAEQLQEENEKLKLTQMIWWFVAGGGVFFVGWIVGKISRQKRFY
jgi:SH3 domain protein